MQFEENFDIIIEIKGGKVFQNVANGNVNFGSIPFFWHARLKAFVGQWAKGAIPKSIVQ